MNTRHQKILERIVATPERSDIPWKDIEGLVIALGGDISEGRGSRVRIHLSGVRAVFHRPHPQRLTDKGAVSSMRRFLKEAKVIS
ncbi:MAG: type II toxin-antitoxin system HicA family toxin [Kiritimatiellae bacterium]|nr:type II toxin-antitoxin system HicA family toxin [Kiritimatiellia bacterium]